MRRVFFVAVIAFGPGCGPDSAAMLNTPFPPDFGHDDGTGGGSGIIGGNGDDTGTGVPCDVAQALNHSCTGCHQTPAKNAAPFPMLTRQDLLASAPGFSGTTVAERC